jgi:hypothetical protein
MPFEIELDTRELDGVARRFPQIQRRLEQRVKDTMGVSMEFLQSLARTIAREKDLVSSGAYLGSIAYVIRGIGLDLRGTLAPQVRHGLPVERGRNPGKQPPREAIELWVRRKLGISGDEEVQSAAFLIARAIGRRGTIQRFGYDGGRVIETTAERGQRDVLKFFDQMIAQIAREIEQL